MKNLIVQKLVIQQLIVQKITWTLPELGRTPILSFLPIFSHNTKNDENEMGEKLPNLNFIIIPTGNDNEIVILGSLKMILRMIMRMRMKSWKGSSQNPIIILILIVFCIMREYG
jgi:hypothetical protein